MSRRVENWVEHVIRSTELTASVLEESRRWDFIEGAGFGELHAPRGPEKILADDGPEAKLRQRNNRQDFKAPTVVDLPKDYYQARAKMNRERDRRSA